MRLKANKLEKLINESIDGVKHGQWDNEKFAIHNDGNIQVQIFVTGQENEKLDLLPYYVGARK